jgi:hypothetical protein
MNFFLFLLLLYWEYIVTFTKIVAIYHSWIHLLHYSPLSLPPPPTPGIVSTDFIFTSSYMSTYFHHIQSPIPVLYMQYECKVLCFLWLSSLFLFQCWIIFHIFKYESSFIHSPLEGHLGCLQMLAVMNKAAINKHLCEGFCVS